MVKNRGWRDAGPLVVAFSSYVLFAAGFVDWTAGWSAAARHLVPIIGLLAMVALFAAQRMAGGRLGSPVLAALIAISGTNAVLSLAVTPFFPPEFAVPIAQLVMPSLADGAGFSNILSSSLGIPSWVAVVLCGVTTLLSLIWAGRRVIGTRSWWLPGVILGTVAMLLSLYLWQGSSPNSESELMRAQVLRRLGHLSIADRIESAVPSDPALGLD